MLLATQVCRDVNLKQNLHLAYLNTFFYLRLHWVFFKLRGLLSTFHTVMYFIHTFLGFMEDNTALGDVELPPWAKGDPQEFIRIHREVSHT